MSVAVGPALVLEDVGASEGSLRAALAVVLEENRELREANAELRERDARREQELERLRADLAVLQRLLFGRSSERSRPGSGGADAGDDGGGAAGERAGSDRGSGEQGGDGKPRRGPGARAGRRDYSHLPRFEMFWDFPDGRYCCPRCGSCSRRWVITCPGSSWTGR
jgi:transposase